MFPSDSINAAMQGARLAAAVFWFLGLDLGLGSAVSIGVLCGILQPWLSIGTGTSVAGMVPLGGMLLVVVFALLGVVRTLRAS